MLSIRLLYLNTIGMTNDSSSKQKFKKEDVDLPLRMEGRWMDSIYVSVFIRRFRDQNP